MKHFSLTEWADFVRGLVPARQKASMLSHLDSDCSRCRRTVEMWTSIVNFSKHEAAYEPPASATRVAESYLVPLKLALRLAHNLKLAQPIFDSFKNLAPEGVRGLEAAPQQLMYQCVNIFIDVRLEPKRTSNTMILTGQVVDSRKPGGGVAGVPVSLFGKSVTLLETVTNQLGEFHFSFQTEQNLRLLLETPDDALLALLPDIDAGTG
jgi:hypothetical protein